MPQEGSGRGAPRGAPGEAPGHEVLGLRREGAAEGRGLALEARDEAPEAVRGGGGEGVLAGQQVEQGHPETPDVRGRGHGGPVELLRGVVEQEGDARPTVLLQKVCVWGGGGGAGMHKKGRDPRGGHRSG